MRKLFILIAALGLIAAGCGGDSGAGSCEGVADDAIQVIQEVIDELDSMSADDLLSAEDEPPAFAKMEQRGEELQAQAEELGCSDATMEELLDARVGDLKADGFFGEALISEFEGEGFFD